MIIKFARLGATVGVKDAETEFSVVQFLFYSQEQDIG
jgi:hypothetical protein